MPHALARPLPRTLLVTVASVLAGGLAALALIALVHTGAASGKATFSISVPHGWKLTRGPAAAVLRSAEGRATVIVRRTGELHGNLRTGAPQLPRRIATARLGRAAPPRRARAPPAPPLRWCWCAPRLTRVRAGAAFVYTFARP